MIFAVGLASLSPVKFVSSCFSHSRMVFVIASLLGTAFPSAVLSRICMWSWRLGGVGTMIKVDRMAFRMQMHKIIAFRNLSMSMYYVNYFFPYKLNHFGSPQQKAEDSTPPILISGLVYSPLLNSSKVSWSRPSYNSQLPFIRRTSSSKHGG